MKKILSLLSMLMITVMAFATDYTDQLTFKLTVGSNSSEKSLPQGTLTIEKRVDGTYNVTASGCDFSAADFGNWGDISCDGVAGTTNADGLTTIEVSKPEVFANGSVPSGYSLSGQSLLVKFNGTKAYALLKGKLALNAIVGYPFEYTFGTDKGFDGGSTGGGETGGETKEKYTVNFDKTAYSTHSGRVLNSFSLQQTGKDKQTESVSASRAAYEDHTSKVFTVEAGSEVTASFNYTGEWMNGYVYIDRDNDGEFSYTEGQWNQASTDLVAYSFYTTLANPKVNDGNGYNSTGASVTGNARNNVNPPAFTAPTEPGTYRIRFKVDWNCILPGGSSEILSDGGGVWDATLEVVVPAPTVDETFTYDKDAYVGTNNTNGTANVKVNKMSDGTYTMEITAPVATKVGEISVGTDAKGRTTYKGEVESAVVSGVKYVVHGVVYTAEDGAKRLYMTLTNDDVTYTIGEDPDYVAPVTYKNTLYVVEKAKLLVETPDAEVVLQDKGDNKYDVTLPAFTADGKDVPSITFEATKADNKLTASNVTVNNVYNGEAAVVTMDGTFESDSKLFASLTVKCGELFDYEVGYGIKPFVATTKEYTAEWANVKVGDAEPVNFQNAKADYTEFAKGQYSLTFKDLTIDGKKVGDFTIKYVYVNETDGKLSTTAVAGTWTRVETDQDVASQGAEATISGFEGTLVGETLAVKFTIAAYGTVAVDFGHKYEAPEPPVVPEVVDVVDADYNPAGQSWQKNDVSIYWDKQYIVAKLDLSTCKTGGAGPENVLAVGTDLTGWNNGPHYFFYYNKADKVLQYNYLHSANKSMNGGYANLSKAYIQLTDEVVTIEISKQGGLKVNGESALVKYIPSATNPSNNNTESWTTENLQTVFSGLWELNPIGFGGCQGETMSNATYKYVKVVPLGWKEPVTPPSVKDTKTFNEALYMVQGTTSSKLADATVEVKEMSDKTINMSLKYMETEYTSTELTKGTDDKNRTTYTGKVSNGSQTYDVAGVVYEKDNAERLYMTMTAAGVTLVVGENPDAVTPDPGVTEESNKTYTSNLRIFDGEEPVVENADAKVNIIKYSDESYKVTLKDVNILKQTSDLVFVGKALIEEAPTEATEPLTIIAKSDEATTAFFDEEMKGTFEITEVSAEEIKMGFVLNNTSLEYQGEFNYTEEETPEVYTNNLHIYDAAAPETDLFQADQAKVEFLATATGGFKLTLKDVTLNEKKSDLVFTGTLPTPQPGGQDPLAEEGETTPAEPAMVLNATADEATATFLGATSATAVFNVSYDKNDNFMMTFTITAGDKNYAGEFNYEKKNPETPDPEKYPINFDKTANSTHNSRALNSFSLQQTGKEKQTKSVKTSKAAYEDHTADEPFTVEAGSELTASFDYTGEWMHSFVYIDFDNDGQFSYKEGQWDQTGTDLVAFSFYSLDSNPKNDASGYNSVGDELTGDARNTYVAPSFKAPAKAGEYRIRFKFDWNCILPGGSSSILSDGGGVWDATLKVVEPVVDGISSINAEVANGETQLFTVNGVKLNKLQKGLNIVRTADGKVKKVLVK